MPNHPVVVRIIDRKNSKQKFLKPTRLHFLNSCLNLCTLKGGHTNQESTNSLQSSGSREKHGLRASGGNVPFLGSMYTTISRPQHFVETHLYHRPVSTKQLRLLKHGLRSALLLIRRITVLAALF